MAGERSACLDRSVLAELRALGGEDDDLLGEVVRLFAADVPVQLEALEKAFVQGDAAGVRQVAHRLKGTGLGSGARQMADTCGAIEAAAAAGDLDTARQASRPLAKVFREALAALQSEVGSSPG